MSFRSLLAVAALAAGMALPASAYTLTGTFAPGGGMIIQPITFTRDGDVTLAVTFDSPSGFALDAAAYALEFVFYDFFDPQTGEAQGGNDNSGADAPFDFYSDDGGPNPPSAYSFTSLYPNARVRRDYVLQNPGDPYPYEVGYTETQLSVRGGPINNADPVRYTITVGGSAVVPEPATWALLIVGFGATGAMMRRRRPSGPLRER